MSKHLQVLPSGYYFRYAIPADLRPQVGGREVRIALGRSCESAYTKCGHLGRYIHALLQHLRETGQPMDIKEIRAHAAAYCNHQLQELERSVRANMPKPSIKDFKPDLKAMALRLLRLSMEASVSEKAAHQRVQVEADLAANDYLGIRDEAIELAKRIGIAIDSPDFDVLSHEMLLNLLHFIEQSERLVGGCRAEYLPEPSHPPVMQVVYATNHPSAHLTHPVTANAADHGKRLSEWVDEFLSDIEHLLPEDRDDKDHRAALDVLVYSAKDCLPAKLTQKSVAHCGQMVLKLPARRSIRPQFKGKNITELLEMNLPARDCISGTTIEKYLRYINQFLHWLHADRHVAANLTIKRPKAARQTRTVPYQKFSNRELGILLSRDNLLLETDLAQFWAPLIAAYSGMRVGEIAYLRVGDIALHEAGILYFNTVDMDDEDEDGEARRLKTDNAYRLIPIHQHLLDIGLMDYIEHLRTSSPNNSSLLGQSGRQLSRWFNRNEPNRNVRGYRSRCGIGDTGETGGRLVFHSFRHSAISSARQSPQLDSALKNVFGHEQGVESTTDRYTHHELPNLKKVIDTIDYGLDHTELKGAWRIWVDCPKRFTMRESWRKYLSEQGVIPNEE